MKRMKWLVGFFFLLLFAGCIEPYDFESDDVDQAIVVDAELADSLFTQEIKISYLNRVSSQQFEGVTNATVMVEDDLGDQFTFIESTPGVYQAFFGADRARKYRLNIEIPNGGRITSDFQGIPPPIQIDSIAFEELKESFVDDDGKNRTINVVKAYGVANINNNEQDLYLRFGNIETVFLFAERKTVSFPPPKTCFVYNKDVVPEIGVFEVKANSNDVAVRSLLFTKPISWEFGTVFSVKADLVSMNRSYFDYWKEIESVYSQDGNITDPPPARIRTNLLVENRPPVIGYFGLASISSDVLFIRNADLNAPIILRCGSLGGPFPWPYPDECNQCLLINGASTVRPEYW